MRTAHIGLPPLQAVSAPVMADEMEIIRIKVPRGLPDPARLIPAANPPTYGKWRLGKKLFFDRILRAGVDTYACATCHDPGHGFTEKRPRTVNGRYNTPSLINAVYNRTQFWDGRVGTLEEVLVRSLDDERPALPGENRDPPEVSHSWGGLVAELAANPRYRLQFEAVFGIAQPTQDAIAKALATYMRTILSADSLYDRAHDEKQRVGAKTLEAPHFLAGLDKDAIRSIGDGKLTREEAARKVVLGSQLFHGKAKCAVCHPGPLFTDHEFHNVGLNLEDGFPPPDKLTGRILAVPPGLKDNRQVGAFKTPTLRALPRTDRYFHDGKWVSLHSVVQFFNREILATPYLADALRDGRKEQQLGLTDAEIDALVLFLEALDGQPVDPVVAAPP